MWEKVLVRFNIGVYIAKFLVFDLIVFDFKRPGFSVILTFSIMLVGVLCLFNFRAINPLIPEK